jgi:hypothetical protein
VTNTAACVSRFEPDLDVDTGALLCCVVLCCVVLCRQTPCDGLSSHTDSLTQVSRADVCKLWSTNTLGGVVGPLGGGARVCVRDIFILNGIWAQNKIYILIGTSLVEIFCLSFSTDTGTVSEL